MSGVERAAIGSEERATFEDLANLVKRETKRRLDSRLRAVVSERVAMTLLEHRMRSMFDRNNVVGHAGLACEQ